MEEEKIELKDLNFEFDLKDSNFEMDALQNEMLQFYLRADMRFKMAFHTNYTQSFITYLKDKVRLREPFHLSVLGVTRSGKSSITSTIGFIVMAMYGKMFSCRYICPNELDFLDKIKDMTEEETKNSFFQIDEQKNYFGSGKVSKATKLQDVQNIIAKHNISTASLCPTKFANPNAHYGFRTMGRDFKKKLVRLMLYNLQESSNHLPMGVVYLPIPELLLSKRKDIYEKFNAEYNKIKDDWIADEVAGKGDVLMEIKRRTAKTFVSDEQYKLLKKKDEKMAFISNRLGSEWAKSEVFEIYQLIEMLNKGIDLDN